MANSRLKSPNDRFFFTLNSPGETLDLEVQTLFEGENLHKEGANL